jgi:nicotinamide-nucleotide amidase
MLSNQELLTRIPYGLTLDFLSNLLKSRGWKLVTAESCTGGLIAATCTNLAGSSDWFERGFVTYSNEAKTAQLGVDVALIAQHGAVSEVVARAMALGAVRFSTDGQGSPPCAQVSISVTGIAGPSGGSAAKPVGTVWFGFCVDGQLTSEMKRFGGDRAAVREATVAHALTRLAELLA